MKREEKKLEKRAAILEVAREEFTIHRFDEVKLDDIAAQAGVGKGTLYLYFKNKEDLFVQMAIDGVEETVERIQEITAMEGDFRGRFLLFGRHVGQFIETRSVMFRLMHQTGSETIHRQVMQHHKKLVEATRALLKAGMDEGILRSDFSPADLHCMLIGPLLFRVRLNKDNKDRVEVESLLELFWKAVAL